MANTGAVVGVGLAGLAVGAALGLLYAPQSGVETRQMLRQRASQMRSRAGEMANRVMRRGQRAAEEMGAEGTM